MNFPGSRCYPLDGNRWLLKIYSHNLTDEVHYWVLDKTLQLLSVNVFDHAETTESNTCDFSLISNGAMVAQFYTFYHLNNSGVAEEKSQFHNFQDCIIPVGTSVSWQATSSTNSNIAVNLLVKEFDNFEGGFKEKSSCDICDFVLGGVL